jgi:hypothetical protein
MLPSCSGLKDKPSKKQHESEWQTQAALPSQNSASHLLSCVSYLAYSLTTEMEATCSSETSADFQWTTQHYIPEKFLIPM